MRYAHSTKLRERQQMPGMNAKVVVLTSYLPNYQLVTQWAERHGHRICLVVTPSADPGHRYGGESAALLAGLAQGPGLLVTAKLRTVAAPAIAALAPDLVISAGFARRIPPEILDVPTCGALNLHPSPLPAGRGPNPARLVYEGATTIGATLHRTEAEFDTGAVLSRRERPLPDELSGPAILAAWLEMFAEVLEKAPDAPSPAKRVSRRIRRMLPRRPPSHRKNSSSTSRNPRRSSAARSRHSMSSARARGSNCRTVSAPSVKYARCRRPPRRRRGTSSPHTPTVGPSRRRTRRCA